MSAALTRFVLLAAWLSSSPLALAQAPEPEGRAEADEQAAPAEPAPQTPAPKQPAPEQAEPAEQREPGAPALRRQAVRADEARGYAREPRTEPEDIALAVPRAVLAVPRYALRLALWPVREGIEFLDRHAVVEEVTDVLYNDARNAAVLPTLSYDSYFGPSLGVRAFHEDLAGYGELGSVEVKAGGVYNLATQLHFRADHYGGSHLWLESVARYESAPALLFQGLGTHREIEGGSGLSPREAAVATRFSERRLLSLLRAGYDLGRPSQLLQLGGTVSYNVRDFGAKQKGAEPSIEEAYDTTQLVGFDDRVAILEADLSLVVDLRDVAGATSSGAYLELFAGRAPSIGRYGFWHHGAELTTYLDLYRKTRVLVLRAMLEGVEGDEAEIPFSELPRLGGVSRLRGYPLDRFRDEKAALGTIEYRYPIHQYVAGALYCDVGRVEQRYSDLLDSTWKVGFGGGFVVRSREREIFTFDVAYGEGVQVHLTTQPLRAFAKRNTEL